MPAPQFIFHIAGSDSWKAQSGELTYSVASLEDEGFIHCSRWEQLARTINRFFSGRTDIVILKIDTKALQAPLIYEAADDGSGFFPHVFGQINQSCIKEVLQAPFDFTVNRPQTEAPSELE